MDDDGVGLLGGLVSLVVVVVLGVGALGGYLYVNDAAVEATVVEKDCSLLGGGGSVTVEAKLVPVRHTVEDVPIEQCQLVDAGEDGSFVRYHVNSGRTILFEHEGGACIYDSARGVGC